MPFRKRYSRKPVKKFRKYRRRSKYGGLRKSVAKLWRQVGSPEYKYTNDVYQDFVTNVGAIYDLCTPSQGIGDLDNRIGDKIRIVRLTMRGHLAWATANTFVRMIIFVDKEESIGTPGDLLTNAGTLAVVDGFKIYDKRFNTRFLMDRRMVINTEVPMKFFKIQLRLNLPVQFNNATTAIRTNALKLMIVGDITTGAAYNITTRVTYVDN